MKMRTGSGKAFLKLLRVNAIEKTKTAFENAGLKAQDHFADVGKMVDIGSNTKREIDDIALPHYACCLIDQNV